ncbi:alpha/beta fold hydrolase [Calothrix sp. NIES-3974]|uniref:alpha/beta fold hydrolase n=1 Tax=Calothrix sp. NIES-3974 TaxID=2005462 RepID=UPI000B5E5E46|nr:alpha/beta hydrolase [Calothrix sp. NIES-3974]BAZ04347.1 hypothetical protein NIES3974_09850 [Calothrix sp. NIES-3974]
MAVNQHQHHQTLTYKWQNYQCTYDYHPANPQANQDIPLVLIHPIGVGLSRLFWRRFSQQWQIQNKFNSIYAPDLLGCGDSDMPNIAYTPNFHAEQLNFFLTTVINQPVILVVQGALFPVAIELVTMHPQLIKGMVLSGPPAWNIISKPRPKWRQKLTWSFLSSILGNLFYRYARTEKFLRSFSTRQLFASSQDIDEEWLMMLRLGSVDMASRFAVFSFLAGFWRKDYSTAIANLNIPTFVVFGETASSVSKEGKIESADDRLSQYLTHLPTAQGVKIPGRNVLPYESAPEFVNAIAPFIDQPTLL